MLQRSRVDPALHLASVHLELEAIEAEILHVGIVLREVRCATERHLDLAGVDVLVGGLLLVGSDDGLLGGGPRRLHAAAAADDGLRIRVGRRRQAIVVVDPWEHIGELSDPSFLEVDTLGRGHRIHTRTHELHRLGRYVDRPTTVLELLHGSAVANTGVHVADCRQLERVRPVDEVVNRVVVGVVLLALQRHRGIDARPAVQHLRLDTSHGGCTGRGDRGLAAVAERPLPVEDQVVEGVRQQQPDHRNDCEGADSLGTLNGLHNDPPGDRNRSGVLG